MSRPNCPECGIEVGSTWRWCLACGYDPDGAQQHTRAAAIEARQRQGSWIPTVVVGVGLLLGGAFLWKTTPSDGSATKTSVAQTAVEWMRYTPPGGGFSVDEPTEPTPMESPYGPTGMPATMYMTIVNGQVLTIAEIDTGRAEFDRGVSNETATAFLTQFAGQVSAAEQAELSSSTATWVGPAPALDFTVDEAARGQLRGRLVLVGRHVYVVTANGLEFDAAIAERFVTSFALS